MSNYYGNRCIRDNLLNGPKSLMIAACICIGFASVGQAAPLSSNQTNDKQEAKNANVAEAKKLNGETPDAKADGKTADSAADKVDSKTKQQNKEITNAVNQVPGVEVQPNDLEPPAEPPIKGFHPIKRLMRPVENLEGMSIKLEQQIMKLTGPIAGLQPPMLGLQKNMKGVDQHITNMQTQLGSVQGQVVGVQKYLGTVHGDLGEVRSDLSGVRGDLGKVRGDLGGVRSDIAAMRKEIESLKGPIVSLQQPITSLQGPLNQVAHPLLSLQAQLNWIILAIMISAFCIAIGTPVAAIQIYKNRHKLFPDLKERDMPKVVPAKEAAGSTRR